ncbi:uncharacterized protein LOC132902871 [Amyelois transitella]|uniref:uncharacterized protein LOC132902871 n=1 Tax=Amyelois transitella TaxID=680683 RepID=UPI00298FF4EC|nr:uncharacterized protein LOC132902871 [Amyelois transitella]
MLKCPRSPAMCWRIVNKKTVQIVLIYLAIYLFISYIMLPETFYTFVSDEQRIGDKYPLIFLVAPRVPALTDAEGADVFKTRGCGRCFVTNNKGFLPIGLYDAVLVVHINEQETAFADPDKFYLIESSQKCIKNKFKHCSWEPKITSIASKQTFDLCGFCDHLMKNMKKPLKL